MQERRRNNELARLILLLVLSIVLLLIVKYYSSAAIRPYDFLFYAALAVAIGIFIISIISLMIEGFGAKKKAEKDYIALSNVFKMLAYAALALVVLDVLRVNITGLLIGAGFVGIVVGLAAQNTLGNLFAGMMLLYAKPFRSGDEIELSTWQYGYIAQTYPHSSIYPGITGKIENIGILYTTITESTGVPVVIPNNIAIQALIFNKNRTAYNSAQVRIELEAKKDFAKFNTLANRAFSKDKYLAKNAKGMRISIEDINMAYYGVSVSFSCSNDVLSKVAQHIKEALLKASSGM